jgi:C-terminal processing protease CtpA/Prc
MLTLASNNVSVGGQVSQRWHTRPSRLSGSATFVLSAGCVSACESVAIAVKERFRTVGQATGGLTTSNDIVRLNRNTLMGLTMGWQTDVTGHYSERITPDELLDDAQLAAMLAGASATPP